MGEVARKGGKEVVLVDVALVLVALLLLLATGPAMTKDAYDRHAGLRLDASLRDALFSPCPAPAPRIDSICAAPEKSKNRAKSGGAAQPTICLRLTCFACLFRDRA